jgi:hypothetical protein
MFLMTLLFQLYVLFQMTKEGFLKNNKGINGDQDLDPEYLSGIYDRILENEIKMKDAREETAAGAPVNAKLRHLSFRRESMALVKKTQQLMASSGGASGGVGVALLTPGSHVTASELSASGTGSDAATAAATTAAAATGAPSTSIPPPTGFYYAATDDITMVTPMFNVLWGPAHATFR